MKSRITFACILLVFPTLAPSQETQDVAYDGQWTASFSRNGGLVEINVKLSGQSGTWGTHPWVSNNKFEPCYNRPMPIRVTRLSDLDITVEVVRSEVVKDCLDDRFDLHLDGRDLMIGRGRFGDGKRDFALRLVRK